MINVKTHTSLRMDNASNVLNDFNTVTFAMQRNVLNAQTRSNSKTMVSVGKIIASNILMKEGTSV